MSATILGVSDTVNDPAYTAAFEHTAKVFEETIKIFDDATNPSRDGWKLKSEHKEDKCYNKRFPLGKVYHLKKEYQAPVDLVFQDHWSDVENTVNWNPSTDYLKRLAVIGNQADVLQYALSDVAVIKGKDFIVCRMYRKTTDGYIVVASSFDTDLPPVPKKTRATANVVAGKFTGLGPQLSTIDFLASVELNDKLIPENLLSKNIADIVIKDARAAHKHISSKFSH
ncbi:unnamed protein product [Caenorhabditis auriculariae]|uniref:START domain-containing protein n=1 Tax=Caenorhabditis auriculariae TaxID=2777116 RepID=A0A8S1GNZ3_9PELO|nr:unnamed protein product [Caenorhabditis auriculariae]